MSAASSILKEEEIAAIELAIAEAEKITSGEIRVHVERKCFFDPVKRAQRIFGNLKMEHTKDRNGILFYIATDAKKFAVVGDEGIHKKVGQDFWNAISASMRDEFRTGNFSKGLIGGIHKAGEQLAVHFPGKWNDKNELSNKVNLGE